MPEWSRREVIRGLGVAGAAGVLGGGWYLAERPHCRSPPEPRWTYRGEYWGPVVPTGRGLLLPEGHGATGGDRYRLAVLDPYRGQAHWTTVSVGGGFGVPALRDGTVYVGTGVDTVRAHDAETGRLRWEYDAGGAEEYGGGAWGRPLVAAGRVYVGVSHSEDPDADPSDGRDYTHRVVALDPADGTELWATDVTTTVRTGAVRVADAVVAASEDGIVRGFDPATGAVRWSVSLPGEPDWRPVVAGETVFVVTTDGVVATVDAADGSVRRRREPIADVTAATFDAGTLYLGGASGRVVALPVTEAAGSTGTRRWTYDAGVRVGALAAGESGTFVVDQSGTLHRVTDDGERGARVPLVESDYENRCGWLPDHEMLRAAVLDDGRLYVSSMWWVRRFSVAEMES
jgi:outer membrane protein assembly factor BamB